MKKKLPTYPGCFVCGPDNPHGLQLEFIRDGEKVKSETVLGKHLAGWQQRIHGGIICTLLDEVLLWACIAKTGGMYYTADFNVRFLAPLAPGEKVLLTGWVSRERKRLVVALGDIKKTDGTTVATASGKYMPIPNEQLKGMERPDVS